MQPGHKGEPDYPAVPLPEDETIAGIVRAALREDIGLGDFTSLACFPEGTTGSAKLISRSSAIIAGTALAHRIFSLVDPAVRCQTLIPDGSPVSPGDIVMKFTGPALALLSGERVVLNFMQRLSGIATATRTMCALLEGSSIRVLDTRKTTPGIRILEKWAVRVGGGMNHRMGLDDMIMLKDNHIDFCGSVTAALERVFRYRENHGLDLKVVVEARSPEEVRAILDHGKAHRILLDNFAIPELKKALAMIGGKMETEASGNIGPHNVLQYKDLSLNYVSSGSLTHSVTCPDLSLKTVI